ncbi:acyltransferase [Chenggangzhangella methanolivorans]|uniref:Acyltransferase n=1 Tax=Chenggangzhangella methanolivorans TaxID=1437009 RepID=A0A9E6RB60_9HYPH|nr:acyltransferase [Chenggangzhangella methanolivorans]
MLYRPEIDGLRAVAVLSVLLYHAAGLVPGGFVGVDVFFVISGYVITKTIAADLAAGSFGLWSFYERRIRRIAPALGVTILATAAASAAILLPIDLEAMGKSAIAAALMVSNMLFWGQAGYFDAAAQAKPLLHTWSLGIETVLPYFSAACGGSLALRAPRRRSRPRRARRRLVRRLDLASAGRSRRRVLPRALPLLGAADRRAHRAASGARARRLGLCVSWPRADRRRGSPLRRQDPVPGPCGAGADARRGARDQRRARGHGGGALLAARPLVLVGKISYSLYLVHWPLIVLVEYRQDARLDATEAWLVIAVSLVLAWISWHFVEQPFRAKAAHPPRAETSDRAKPVTRPQLVAAAAAVTALCCAVGGVFAHSEGLPERLSPEVRAVYGMIPPDRSHDHCFVDTRGRTGPTPDDIRAGRLCSLGAPPEEGRPRFLVWGDSHAAALAPGIFKAGDEAGLKGLFVGAGSCPPLEDFRTLTARRHQPALPRGQRRGLRSPRQGEDPAGVHGGALAARGARKRVRGRGHVLRPQEGRASRAGRSRQVRRSDGRDAGQTAERGGAARRGARRAGSRLHRALRARKSHDGGAQGGALAVGRGRRAPGWAGVEDHPRGGGPPRRGRDRAGLLLLRRQEMRRRARRRPALSRRRPCDARRLARARAALFGRDGERGGARPPRRADPLTEAVRRP